MTPTREQAEALKALQALDAFVPTGAILLAERHVATLRQFIEQAPRWRPPDEVRAQAEKWHDEETLGGPDCNYRELEIHAYIAGAYAALPAPPSTAKDDEHGEQR